MTCRIAPKDDTAAMADIFNQYLAKATMVLVSRSEEAYLPLVQGARSVVYVVTEEESVVGYASVKAYSDRGGYSLAGEASVYLDEETTGKGYGKMLYELVLPAAYKLGYRHLTAKIWANNTGSIQFHDRFGFRMVGTQKSIGWIEGKRIDTVIMEKIWD